MKKITISILLAAGLICSGCDNSAPQDEISGDTGNEHDASVCDDFTGNWSPLFDECYSEQPDAFAINQETCTLYLCDATEPAIDSETGDELPIDHIDNPGCVAYADENMFFQDGDSFSCEATLTEDFLYGYCSDLAGPCFFLYQRATTADCESHRQICNEICQSPPEACTAACTAAYASCTTEPVARSGAF